MDRHLRLMPRGTRNCHTCKYAHISMHAYARTIQQILCVACFFCVFLRLCAVFGGAVLICLFLCLFFLIAFVLCVFRLFSLYIRLHTRVCVYMSGCSRTPKRCGLEKETRQEGVDIWITISNKSKRNIRTSCRKGAATYVHMHGCTRIYKYATITIYTQIYMYACIYDYTHSPIYICTCALTYTYIHIYIHMLCIFTSVDTCMHACICTTGMHTNKYIYIYMYIDI